MFEPTAKTHVMIGTFRPPFHRVVSAHKEASKTINGGVIRPFDCVTFEIDGEIYSVPGFENLRVLWEHGTLDTPVYATRQEIIDSIGKSIAGRQVIENG